MTATNDRGTFAEVERLFRDQIEVERLHPGAALAVYRHGRLVLDLAGGWADAQRAEPVGADTLFVLLSAAKPIASVALLQQIERGKAALDDPVAEYWPAFARNGKAEVTLRHILTHRGGFPETPAAVETEGWQDTEKIAREMEGMTPSFPPGTVSAYHHLTQQWVTTELVRLLDGRAFPVYLREEITGPLGMTDTFAGVPADQECRVAMIHATEFLGPIGTSLNRQFNRFEVRRAPAPVCMVATARDLARFYAALAGDGTLDGTRVLRPETVERALTIEIDGEVDRTMGEPFRWGLGFKLGGARGAAWMGSASTARSFGHNGAGTVSAWGDRDLGLGVAYVTNGVRYGPECRRVIADAVRAACRAAIG